MYPKLAKMSSLLSLLAVTWQEIWTPWRPTVATHPPLRKLSVKKALQFRAQLNGGPLSLRDARVHLINVVMWDLF
ncbi:hypothetical protein DFH09DRAFT_1180114 [Mycena vulgaris]|nr:hypothetical protein DFH09DRAFT_1180114 [Mycena vulgaris]